MFAAHVVEAGHCGIADGAGAALAVYLRHAVDEERDGADGPRATSWSWDAPRTAYFHLLTSQWGPIVKPLSDGAAWVRRLAPRRRRRG